MNNFLAKLRRNHLLVFFTIGFIVTLGAVLLELDRNYYQTKKREYINNNWNTIFPLNKEDLTLKCRMLFEGRTEQNRTQYRQDLDQRLQEIVDSPMSIYAISLIDDQSRELITHEAPQKLNRYNIFKNALFFQEFTGKAELMIGDRTGTKTYGRLIVHYTTPLGDTYIQQLTTEYRLYSLLIIIGLGLVYFYIVRYLLLPVKKVVGSLDIAKTGAPTIIPFPGSYLERVYNNLSRDALLSRIHYALNEMGSKTPIPELSLVYGKVPRLLTELFNFPLVAIIELKRTPDGAYEAVGCHHNISDFAEDYIAATLDQLKKNISLNKQRINRFFEHNLKLMFVKKQKRWWFVDKVYATADFDILDCLVIIPVLHSEKELSDWNIETLHLIARQLSDGITAIELRRQKIFKEKSETNIHLARRLGHDLTNIIATSKLDLLSIKDYLHVEDPEFLQSPQKREIFRQSLKGLLNNTRFLQEIVNIYNSFSFVKSPVYRKVNVNNLIDEIVNVFNLAMSRNVQINLYYQPDLPGCVVEERLLKLAIFNLLSNSARVLIFQQTIFPTMMRSV